MKPIFSCRQARGMALSGAASTVLALGMNAGAMALPDGCTGAIAHVSYSSIAVADALFQCPASFEHANLAPVAELPGIRRRR